MKVQGIKFTWAVCGDRYFMRDSLEDYERIIFIQDKISAVERDAQLPGYYGEQFCAFIDMSVHPIFVGHLYFGYVFCGKCAVRSIICKNLPDHKNTS